MTRRHVVELLGPAANLLFECLLNDLDLYLTCKMGDGNLDAHARPPDDLRVLFKKWQKQIVVGDANLVDPASVESDDRVQSCIPTSEHIKMLHSAFLDFANYTEQPLPCSQIHEMKGLPGERPCLDD